MVLKGGLKYLQEVFSDLTSEKKEIIDWKLIWSLFLFAFLLRLPLIIYPEVIHNDGTLYIRHARQILAGDWTVGKTHPFYPMLVAIAHFFTPNDEIAGIWVSVILGALLVFPVFYLGKAIFNERVGVISALFAAIHPFLYKYSGSVLTESSFYFLLATSALFGWKAYAQGRFIDIFLFGLFTSFSYLTRPEAIGFLLILSLWVLLTNPPTKTRSWKNRLGIILLAIFSFLVFSSPYLILLRKETGEWQISKKVSVSIGSFSDKETEIPIEMIRVKKEISLSSLFKSPLSTIRKMVYSFLESLYKFQQVYNPILSILLLLGFLLGKGKSLSIKGNLYIVSYLIYFFSFVHPFFWVTRRYTSHVISICLPWAAIGFLELLGWMRKRFNEEVQKKLSKLLLILILVILIVHGRVLCSRDHRFIQRDVGLWMKANLPKGVKVMSRLPQEAFYAEMEWIRMPQGSYNEVFRAARSKGVKYLIIDEKIKESIPDFKESSPRGELTPIMTWKRNDQWRIVFEVP